MTDKPKSTPGLIVNRTRLTRAHARAGTLLSARYDAAQKNGGVPVELAQEMLAYQDETVRLATLQLPDGWLPDGVTLDSPDWQGKLSQEHYAAIEAAATPPEIKGPEGNASG